MASISIAVAAAGAALGAGSIAQCSHLARQNKQVEVDVNAVAKTLGVLRCRVSGGFLKSQRHVTLLGDVLVVSRRPGSADTIISLQGAEVVDAGTAVKVVSHGGAVLATFWPGSADEASEWAAELRRQNCSKAVPKFLSITRQQREQITAEISEWEDEIKKVQSRPSYQQAELFALEDKIAQSERKIAQSSQELEKFSELPKLVSLNRRQIAELESSIQQRESRVVDLQAQHSSMQETAKMLSLSRREIASLEAGAAAKESTVAELQSKLQGLQDVPKMLSLSRRARSSLEAESAEKDDQIAEMRASLESTLGSEVPKALSEKRRAVSQREQELGAKDARIRALEAKLQGFKGQSEILSFNQKQVEELEQRRRDTEKKMEDFKTQLETAPAAPGA